MSPGSVRQPLPPAAGQRPPALLHLLQQPVRAQVADAPGDAAVLGDGLAQAVAHHGILEAVRPVPVVGEVVVDDTEGLRAVVVVGIDDRKGPVDELPGGQHRVGSAPGLLPAQGDAVSPGKALQLLEGVGRVHAPADARAHQLPEVRLQFPVDDKDNLLESGPPGIVDGVVDNALSVSAHGVHLLEAAVAAAHAGSQDDQNRFLHMQVPPSIVPCSPRRDCRGLVKIG